MDGRVRSQPEIGGGVEEYLESGSSGGTHSLKERGGAGTRGDVKFRDVF